MVKKTANRSGEVVDCIITMKLNMKAVALLLIPILATCTASPATNRDTKSSQVLQLTGTPELDSLARSLADGISSVVTFGIVGVILAFWVTMFVNWAVGFETEKRRSDEYYWDPYSGYYYKQTNRRQDDDSLSDKILQYTDSLGNIIDRFGNAIDVRPTISRMGKGAINGVGTITNAVASGVSSGVVGTVGAVSDGVDAVAYGVTGGIKAVGDGVSGGIKAVGKGVSGGIRAVNNGVVGTIHGVKHGVTGGISRVSTGVSSSLNTVKSTAKVLTSFVTDQRLKDCLLQTVCYLTPLTEEEEEVVGFEGRKKTKDQRKKNKEAKKKEKKKNKKEKKKKNKKNKDKEVSDDDEYDDEDDYDYDDDLFGDDDEEDDDTYDEDEEDVEEEVEEVEDCEVFKCNAVTNGYTAYKLYRSINDIRQKLDL